MQRNLDDKCLLTRYDLSRRMVSCSNINRLLSSSRRIKHRSNGKHKCHDYKFKRLSLRNRSNQFINNLMQVHLCMLILLQLQLSRLSRHTNLTRNNPLKFHRHLCHSLHNTPHPKGSPRIRINSTLAVVRLSNLPNLLLNLF